MRRSFGLSGGSPSLVALGRFVALGFSLITIPIVARALGPDGRGVSAAMLSTLALATVALGIGVPLAMRRRLTEGEDRADVVAAGRLFAVATTVPAMLLGFGLDWLLFRTESVDTQLAFLISMTLIPLSVSWAQDVSVLVAARQFTKMAIMGAIQAAATLAITLALWVAGSLTISAVIYASLAGNIVTFVVGLIWVRGFIGRPRLTLEITREGFTLIGAQLSDVASKRLDQVIALPLLGATGAGLYSVAATVAGLAAPIAHALSTGMFNRMVGASGREQSGPLVIRYGLVLGVPTALGLSVLSLVGIVPLFGADFAGAVVPSVILACTAPAVIASYGCSMWLAAQRRGSRLTVVQAILLVVTVGTFVLGSVLSGVVGGAIGVLIAGYVGLFLTARLVERNPGRWMPRCADIPAAFRATFRS